MGGDVWGSKWGVHAQLLLLDQIARNAFSGTPECLAASDLSLKFARAAFARQHDIDNRLPEGCFMYVCVALYRSEDVADHSMLETHIVQRQDTINDEANNQWYGKMLVQAYSHTDVLRRFGRYPDRNKALGRQTTAAEQAWLDDIDKRDNDIEQPVPPVRNHTRITHL